MKIIRTIEELQNIRKTLNKNIGFVPTMGALHKGHTSLIKQARLNNEITIVSIFINPTQFLAHEDLSSYPKNETNDINICKENNVDYLFMPSINIMYQSNDEILIKAPKISSYILEGVTRPSHFDGVLQIVLKLFNLIQPKNAYFGKKDAQQLSLISQMVQNLFLPINIIGCEIIREDDGLALSSRNVYLNKAQRVNALTLSTSLNKAKELILKDEYNISIILKEMNKILDKQELEYLTIVDRNFNQISSIEKNNTIILLLVRFGNTRLLDNLWI